MSNELNATYLFENTDKNSLLPCSESFWTSAFAFFLQYLSAPDSKYNAKINIWKGNENECKPWYEPLKEPLLFKGLKFDQISIEPEDLSSVKDWSKLGLSLALTGISPDLFFKIQLESNKGRYVIIENKVTSYAIFGVNQRETYPELVENLLNKKVDIQYYVLQSLGCCGKLSRQTLEIQKRLNKNFGIILWEDILRQMIATNFSIGDFNPKGNKWGKFTEALKIKGKYVDDYDPYDHPLKSG